MKTIFSISSDTLSFLKLKLLDEQFKSDHEIKFQTVFIGAPADLEELNPLLGEFSNSPICIDVEPTSIAQHTARSFLECETLFSINQADLILVPDASNAALASALVGIKKPIPVLTLEAGLRSNDRRQHSEINRKAIDSISELFFTTEAAASKNLINEGVDEKVIYEVGNLYVEFFSNKQLPTNETHVLCYFSHPSNEKDPVFYRKLISILNDVAYKKEIILPLEDSSVENLTKQKLLAELHPNIRIISSPSPKELIDLIKDAALVLTDDGNSQVLASALQRQCITFGSSTAHPSTVEHGPNHLVGIHLHEMRNLTVAILEGYKKKSKMHAKETSNEIKKVIKLL